MNIWSKSQRYSSEQDKVSGLMELTFQWGRQTGNKSAIKFITIYRLYLWDNEEESIAGVNSLRVLFYTKEHQQTALGSETWTHVGVKLGDSHGKWWTRCFPGRGNHTCKGPRQRQAWCAQGVAEGMSLEPRVEAMGGEVRGWPGRAQTYTGF